MSKGTIIDASAPAIQKPGNQDIFFAVGIAAMLAILFLPLPTLLLDFGLVISFSLSLLILMVSLWIKRPLEFSAFPLVLLITTMLRLSLNIATTRGILANGHEGEEAAGQVIAAFAEFMMGGDFVIGLIVFAILIIINFIVISKGATRIAEVSARFTLDGIPGKQMAIDADLSSGLITTEIAQKRRRELEEESAFFGAMDGASKFVRGDAVAGLIITFINIFGGIIIGVLRYDMPVGEAADVFTKLSVGDGLVSQIPALITSLAAGLLVSKGQTLGAAHETFFAQLSASPRALHVTGGILVVMAVMPGLPMLPFMTLAVACFAAATIIPKRAAIAENMALALTRANSTAEQKQAKDSIKTSLDMPKIELALGRQLSARLLSDHSELANRVGKMRKRFARQFGFIVPEITLSDDLDLPPKDYELRVHGSAVARASLPLGELTIILGERAAPDMPYEPYTEPAFGLKAAVIPLAYSSQAKQAGYEPVEDVSVLLTHVSETLSRNLAQLLSYGDVRALLDRLAPEYHRLLDEISPQHLSLSGLQAILKLLLAEQVSVRNLALILEAIAEVAPHVKRPEPIVEHVRMRIGQQICADIADKNSLKVLRLGTTWEQAFQQALRRDPRGEAIGFDFEPKDIEIFGKEASIKISELQNAGHRFAIVTAPDVRIYVRMVIERMYPALPVLSHVEIARGAKIEVLGSVS